MLTITNAATVSAVVLLFSLSNYSAVASVRVLVLPHTYLPTIAFALPQHITGHSSRHHSCLLIQAIFSLLSYASSCPLCHYVHFLWAAPSCCHSRRCQQRKTKPELDVGIQASDRKKGQVPPNSTNFRF